MPTLCTAQTSYKKSPGLLELTDQFLQWTPAGSKHPSLRVPSSQASSLFCSKEGAAQVRLKLALVNDDAGYNFTFLASQPVALKERDKFKTELSAIISGNRNGPAEPTPAPTAVANNNKGPTLAATSSGTPTPPSFSQAPTPRSGAQLPPASSDRRGADRASTPILAGTDAAADFRLRRVVLMANPDLLGLHRELVMSGQISEAEFWDGREHMLLAQAAMEGQQKGKPGQIVDPRPEAVEGGEVRIRITPQLVHDIFDEYPVVAKAYNDNVPHKLTEEEFWKRYFQSKLFNAHRASIRSTATQHVVKDDPIFDKYMEKVDDELEPRKERAGQNVDIFVNLFATQEDHHEVGNTKDVTMQAGRQRGALPLIRKFNEHSERLLNTALGEGPASKRRRTDDGTSASLLLSRYFESGSKGKATADDELSQPHDAMAFIRQVRVDLHDWANNLSKLSIERKHGDTALLTMTQNVAPRLETRIRRNEIPEPILRQMTTCQTAANEFLRQFWSAMYPPRSDALQSAGGAPASAAQRATKVAKMAGYLARTPEKVEALVQRARADGVDSERVRTAMKPVLDAAERAVVFHQTKRLRP
ncbi:hypothetical protein BDV98DRAFT_612465 [Pterulicium gracile]|uniref:BSD domain-containing protein n=1 Tax=Pterulicium gracile TaxID=1884261 RepID=A0A5C3QMU7_9AGAR|nr:hypothetical protein BDV98DRAFT_612465 [Pterula gracilis]